MNAFKPFPDIRHIRAFLAIYDNCPSLLLKKIRREIVTGTLKFFLRDFVL